MFGLLRYRKQCKKDHAWKQWRLHYCGTCKTMGRTYGQASRMLLNHDTVYLAEVLTALSPKPIEWNASFRSFNCFALPDQSPAALRLAAAATVALTEYKLRDHIDDSQRWRRLWNAAHRWWNPRFRRAVRELRSLQFDVDALDAALTQQSQAESSGTTLEALAQPTATAVSLFFEHGATLVDRPELSPDLKLFGHYLGTLVYLLDAIEDQHKDQAAGQFNALTALQMTRDQAIAELDKLSQSAIATLKTIDLALAATFASRLRANLDPRLGRSLAQCCTVPTREPWKQRWSKAWDRAEDLAEGRAWPVLAAVAASIFLYPDHAKSADSADECISLSANLMALSSVVAVAIGSKRKRKAAAVAAAGTGAAAADASTGGGCCMSGCCDGCSVCEACGECGCDICGDCACDSCCECGSCCEC